MPSGAWESLHGGSRKWFPEQSADPSLEERVRAWRQANRSRTADGRDSRTISAERWTGRRRPTEPGTRPGPRPSHERVLGSQAPGRRQTGPGAIFGPAMRTPYRKQHVTVRARTRCRLAVLPRDRLDSQALLGAAGQQTSRLQAHNSNPADGDPWVLTNPLPGPMMAAASLCLARFARRRRENEIGGTGTPSAPPGWRRPRSRLRRTRRPRNDHRRWR
jgi:hypothetical protein